MAIAKRDFALSRAAEPAPQSNSEKLLYNRCYNFACLTCLLCFNPKSLICGPDGRPLEPCRLAFSLAPETAPSSGFLAYVIRLISHAKITPYTLTLALNYIYRFRMALGDSEVGALGSEYVLLVTALMVANKMHEDVSYTTRSWATMSQIPAATLTSAERKFLSALNYDLLMPKFKWNLWQYDLTALLRLHGRFRTLVSRSNMHGLPPQVQLGIAATPLTCAAK